VWVAAGTYYGLITVRHGIALYGGFTGIEQTRLDRNGWVNITRLDGYSRSPVVSIEAGADATTGVDGFAITGGGVGYPYRPNGGGVLARGKAFIRHNLIVGNYTYSGSGIYVADGSPIISNNVLSDNDAAVLGATVDLAGSGAPQVLNNTIVASVRGIRSSAAAPVIANNIVVYNDEEGIAVDAGTPVLRNNDVFGSVWTNYSGVQDPTGQNGNVSTDPKVVCWDYYAYNLRPASPCIDAGSDAYVVDSLDAQSRARTLGPHTDIGAFEFAPIAYTLTDVVRALRIGEGLVKSTCDDLSRLDTVGGGASENKINVADAVRILRKVQGLETP
jgi:parallel beta-helix repeat protein